MCSGQQTAKSLTRVSRLSVALREKQDDSIVNVLCCELLDVRLEIK